MKEREFCYWLQGFFELSECEHLSASQTRLIKRHLAMVFAHDIDPSYGDDGKQKLLSSLHSTGEPIASAKARC